jgi:TonB family protein
MNRAHPVLAALILFAPGPAFAAGRPSLNVYFQSNLKDAAYQKKTFEKVAGVWAAPAASQIPETGKKTVVQAVIRKDGTLVSTLVSMRTGKKGWDEAALAAVKSAAPFSPLPANYGAASIEVHFHFSVVP